MSWTGLLQVKSGIFVTFPDLTDPSIRATCEVHSFVPDPAAPGNTTGVLTCVTPSLPSIGQFAMEVGVLNTREAQPAIGQLQAVAFADYTGGVDVYDSKSYQAVNKSDSAEVSGVSDSSGDAGRATLIGAWLIGAVMMSLVVFGIVLRCCYVTNHADRTAKLALGAGGDDTCCCGIWDWNRFKVIDPFVMTEFDDTVDPSLVTGSVPLFRRSVFGGLAFVAVIIVGVTLMIAFVVK